MSDDRTILFRIAVEAWFQDNRDEVLNAKDIAHKFSEFGHHHSTIHTKLAPLVQNGTLTLAKDKHGEQVYSAGPNLAHAKPQRKRRQIATGPQRNAPVVTPEMLAAIPLEKNTPIHPRGNGGSKWTLLFAGLDEPNTSKPIPTEWHNAVAATATKRNRKAGRQIYAVRRENATQSRLYRIAA